MKKNNLPLGSALSQQQLTQHLIKHSPITIMVADARDGRLIEVNNQACQNLGYQREELLEQYIPNLVSIYHQKNNGWAERIAWYKEQGQIMFQTEICCKDNSLLPVEINLSYISDETHDYIIGFVRNITQHKRNEQLKDNERHILELIAKGNTSFTQILLSIIKFAESQQAGMSCSILLLENGILNHTAAPNLPDDIVTAIGGMKIGPDASPCGSAVYYKQRVIVENIQASPLCTEFYDVMLRHNFIAWWSEPILDSNGEILGTFAMYHNESCSPNKHEINLIHAMANFVAIAIERERMAIQLERSSFEWTQAMDKFDDVIYLLDKERRLVRANQAFYQMINANEENCIGRVINELIHPDGEKMPCPVCQAQAEQRDDVIVMEADHPDNPRGRPTEFTIKMIRDKSNAVAGIVMKSHDLSLSRQLEQQHRLSTTAFESIAEGIEAKRHADLLQQAGCQEGQGYLYSRPITAGEITNVWLKPTLNNRVPCTAE